MKNLYTSPAPATATAKHSNFYSSFMRLPALRVLLILLMMVGVGNVGWGQIAMQDFDATNTMTYSASGGTTYTGSSASGDRIPSSPFYVSGTTAYGVTNSTATLTFANQTGLGTYTSKYFEFRLAAWSIASTNNGVDGTDIVTVEVSSDGGTTWSSELRVLGSSASNAWWDYTTGIGSATVTYDGNNVPTDFQPTTASGQTTNGFSTIKVNLPDAGTQARLRITMLNNSAGERWTIDNVKLAGNAAIVSTTSGNWSNTATWVGGVVPTSASNVIIANGHTVTMDVITNGINTRNAGTTTTVDAGGALATNVTYINNGTTTINGSFQLNPSGWVSDAGGTNSLFYGSNGTLIFNNTYTANNGNYWPTTSGPVNVTVNTGCPLTLGFARTVTGTFQTAAAVTLSSTLTLNGFCQLNGGGSFNSAPTYGAASTLVYNTSYGVFNEWTGNGAAGLGIPFNVIVQNSSTLTLTTSDRGIAGSLNIASGNLTLNGTSGDLYIGGNWTNAGTFTPSGRAVFFNGTGTQTITNATSETFNYLVNNKASGALTLANNVTVNATAGSPLQILNAGTIDLNGKTLTLSNNGGNIQVTGAARSITSAVAGGILSITGTKTVSSTSSGALTLGPNAIASLTSGLDFGSGLTTLNGKLQINAGGYVQTNPPVYGGASTLEYNGVTGYGVGSEWTGNAATAGIGVPQNVTLTSSSVTMPGATRGLAGNLTIGTGSTLALSSTFGADFNIAGNLNNGGTFTPNSRLVAFNGTSAQTLTGTTTFDYLTLNNSTGLALQTSSPVTVNQTLELTLGKITIGANNLTVGGTMSGYDANKYVVTASTGQLKRTVAASATDFPVGNTAYNPITFTNSGTSDMYGVRVVNGAISTGANNLKTVSRSWVTTEAVAGGSNLSVVAQYNTGEPNTGFAAGTNPFIGFYNGSAWTQVAATLAGTDPFTATSTTNSAPADLTAGTQYFAIGKDNAFLSIASTFVITAITPASPTAGSGFSVTVRSQDAYGAFANVAANTAFTLSTNGNAGLIGGTVTGTITAGASTVTVAGVTLASAGTLVTLTATQTSGDALATGTSSTFTVLAAASQLAFVGVPGTGNVGVNLTTFTVEARRPDNSVDNTYTGNIVITKASGTGILSGTTTVSAVAGIATFSTLQFDAASTYTLMANSGVLTSATSGNIGVTLLPVSVFANTITGTNPSSSNPYTIGQTFDSRITVSGIARGAGITAATANDRYSAASWSTTTIDLTDYFEFTLTPNTGYYIDFSDFMYTGQSSGTGPTVFAFRSSLDGYTANIGSPTSVGATISLNSSPFDLIIAPISFRIYGYTAGAGTGTFSINDFIFNGNVLCIQPTTFAVTGGGAYCSGGTGVAVGLANSQIGINYQLKLDGSPIGSVPGSGSAISFGNQTVAGTYTVDGINTNGTCNYTVNMSGSVDVTVNALPTAPTVSEIQPTCLTSDGSVAITSSTSGLTFSTDGVTYAAYTVPFVVAADANYSITAKNVAGCVSLATTGTMGSQPATPTAPTASENQPTCVSSDGSVSITSTTTDLTFSFNGGTYAADASPYVVAASASYTITAMNLSGCISSATSGTMGAQPTAPSVNAGPASSFAVANTAYNFPGFTAANYSTIAWVQTNESGPAGSFNDSDPLHPIFTPSATGVNRFTVTVTDLCDNTASDEITLFSLGTDPVTWSGGANNNDWYTQANWLELVIPSADFSVIIPANLTYYPIIGPPPSGSDPAACKDIQIVSGASLIDLGGNLTVHGTVLVDHESIAAGRWHLISSPVTDAKSGLFKANYLRGYNPASGYYEITDLTTSIAPKLGYALFPDPSAFTAAYKGSAINSGDMSITLTAAPSSVNGWNLVGNPYTSAINWDLVAKSHVNGAIYIENGSNWASYNVVGTNGGSNYIAPTQGFFVQANSAGTLELSPAVQVHHSTTLLKKAEETVSNLIRLQVSGNGYKDDAVVRFASEATSKFDGEWDAYKFFGTVPASAQLYTLGTDALSINSLPATETVPVGIKVGVSGRYTIAATEINDLSDAILEDVETSVFTPLAAGPYTFNAEPGTFDQRFKLHFSLTSIPDAPKVSAQVYSYQRTVHINLKDQQKGDIFIYNITGQLIKSIPSASGTNEIMLPVTGNYIVKVVGKNGTTVRKVWIQ